MTLITRVLVKGVKPVPWKASRSSSGFKKATGVKFTTFYKDSNLDAFQNIVREFAHLARNPTIRLPALGPIHLDILVWRMTLDEELWGRPAYKEFDEPSRGFGDLRNITKAIEDALQGIIFQRDSQVCSTSDRSYWGPHDILDIHAFALDPDQMLTTSADG